MKIILLTRKLDPDVRCFWHVKLLFVKEACAHWNVSKFCLVSEWLRLLPLLGILALLGYLTIRPFLPKKKKQRDSLINLKIQKENPKVVNEIDIEDLNSTNVCYCRCWRSKTVRLSTSWHKTFITDMNKMLHLCFCFANFKNILPCFSFLFVISHTWSTMSWLETTWDRSFSRRRYCNRSPMTFLKTVCITPIPCSCSFVWHLCTALVLCLNLQKKRTAVSACTVCFVCVIRSCGDQSVCVGRTQTVLLLLYDNFFTIHPERVSHQSFWFCSFTLQSLNSHVVLYFSIFEKLFDVINTMFLFCFSMCQYHNWVTFVAVK